MNVYPKAILQRILTNKDGTKVNLINDYIVKVPDEKDMTIKARTKRDKRWVTGKYQRIEKSPEIKVGDTVIEAKCEHYINSISSDGKSTMYEIDDCILCKSTGIYDINNDMIYSDDIVYLKTLGFEFICAVSYYKKMNGFIFIDCKSNQIIYIANASGFKIVGNRNIPVDV